MPIIYKIPRGETSYNLVFLLRERDITANAFEEGLWVPQGSIRRAKSILKELGVI